MRWNAFNQEYLKFSKKESLGIFSCLLILFLLFIAPSWIPSKDWNETISSEQKAFVDSLLSANQTIHNTEVSETATRDLFFFDPNQTDSLDWLKLGVPPKTIKAILNYVSKGGRFRKPDDLLKIYNLPKEMGLTLVPYVKINNEEERYLNDFEKKENSISSIDINQATATDLMKTTWFAYPLPYKIISYRDRLGGFNHIQQIKEVSGFTDSLWNKINTKLKIAQPIKLKKLNINTATEEDLSLHPYITYTIAKAIVIYRNQHGKFNQVSDLKKIVILQESQFSKMEPYLTVEHE